MQCEALKSYMPSDDEAYMNQRQVRYFREQLLEQRFELQSGVARSRNRLQGLRAETPDPVDLSLTETKIAMALSDLGRYQKKLWMVSRALERIEEGTFGYCVLTGGEIGIRRLMAMPFTTLSVDAQEMLETAPGRPADGYGNGFGDWRARAGE